MKLAMMAVLAGGFMLASAQAPTEVKTTFEKTHPNTKVEWKLENGVWNAYYKDTKTTTVRTEGYDKSGKKIYDRTEVKSSDIPAGVKSYYTTNFPKVTTYRVYSESSDNTISYFTDIDGKRYYFNSKGDFIESRPLNP